MGSSPLHSNEDNFLCDMQLSYELFKTYSQTVTKPSILNSISQKKKEGGELHKEEFDL